MIFSKKLILSSVFAIGAFGLIACGDSKSSEPDPNDPGAPVDVPTQQDANITLSNELIGDGLLTNSRLSGDDMRFKGRFGLDITKDSSENDINITFTNIEYQVLDAENRTVAVNISSNPITFPTPSDIDLNSMYSAGVKVDMTDSGFTACGKFSLVVTVTANNGAKDFFSTVQIPFEREAAEYCRSDNPEPPPEPVKQEVSMSFCEVTVSTNITPGIDFATCTATAEATAGIIFAKAKVGENNEITASSGNGTTFAPITNGDLPPYTDDYEVNMWPEDMNADRSPATAYVSDFMFKTAGPTLASMIENANQIYVALAPGYSTETGVGFYAFAIVDAAEGNNGDYDLTVKVYKVP